MTDDFNIRNINQDLLYPHHLIYSNTLWKVADGLNLDLSIPINPVLIQYTNNPQDLNSVISLMFLYAESNKFNNH